jgi:hypothetical protein
MARETERYPPQGPGVQGGISLESLSTNPAHQLLAPPPPPARATYAMESWGDEDDGSFSEMSWQPAASFPSRNAHRPPAGRSANDSYSQQYPPRRAEAEAHRGDAQRADAQKNRAGAHRAESHRADRLEAKAGDGAIQAKNSEIELLKKRIQKLEANAAHTDREDRAKGKRAQRDRGNGADLAPAERRKSDPAVTRDPEGLSTKTQRSAPSRDGAVLRKFDVADMKRAGSGRRASNASSEEEDVENLYQLYNALALDDLQFGALRKVVPRESSDDDSSRFDSLRFDSSRFSEA